ncbi:MAG: DUF6196 family protein [Trueperaceae bacterium]
MYISQEKSEETQKRLLKVIAATTLRTYVESYTFQEFPLAMFPSGVSAQALAFVRDDEVWSQLIPSSDESLELFTIFSFHFQDGVDNSGFVGWLASHLKKTLGTGVFVVCGHNSKRGGIFDYWGSPVALGKEVLNEIENLREQGRSLV